MTIANPERPEELVLQLIGAVGPEAEEEILSVADYLEERGRLKGLDEGRREGRLEGQQSMLLKQLSTRFGALPEAVVQRIQAADAQLLDGWIGRVLTASTLDEALAEG